MDTAAVAAAFRLTGGGGQPIGGTWQWKAVEVPLDTRIVFTLDPQPLAPRR